jgi:hypothetical protein
VVRIRVLGIYEWSSVCPKICFPKIVVKKSNLSSPPFSRRIKEIRTQNQTWHHL